MGVTHRTHVSYIDRTRAYYAALGYERPYQYAHHTDAPFARLARPLSECRAALVTTASPWNDDPAALPKPFERSGVWAGDASSVPERLLTENRSWDKESTHTRDVQSFLPIGHLKAHAEAGRIAGVGPRFYGVPTEYSQSRTLREDAPAIEAMCREDRVDVVLLAAL
jgi:hypothetical protein